MDLCSSQAIYLLRDSDSGCRRMGTSGRLTNPNCWGRMDLLVMWRVATTDSWTVQLPKSRVGTLNSRSEEVTWAYTVRGTGRVCVDNGYIRILLGYSQDTCRILLGYCRDMVRILLGYCQDMVGILLGYCQDMVRILIRYCQDMVRILSGYCSIYQTVHKIISHMQFQLKSNVYQMIIIIQWKFCFT